MGKARKENRFDPLISPFGLVLILTLLTFILVLGKGRGENLSTPYDFVQVFGFWQNGFFSLMGFTLQMMMILVFGYALAVFEPVNLFLRKISTQPSNLVSAVLLTASVTMLAGLLNWGFGLIIGAVLARFIHEGLIQKKKASNPGLLAASGYLGMGIWHGGLSASAPLNVAEKGHFLADKIGEIPVEETIFSFFNLISTAGLFVAFFCTAWVLARIPSRTFEAKESLPIQPIGSGREDNLARVAGVFMLVVIGTGLILGEKNGLGFISLNWVNFLLFSVTLIAFRSLGNFTASVRDGLKSSTDIFIQFPFYAGILGLISDSGLLAQLSKWSVELINPEFFPLTSFFSAALVNLFVPSGGGQWAIQGPIVMESAAAMGLDRGKMIMVFAFGDQISNLLQPFWALPLLSITGISVKKIFPYTLIFFLVGLVWLSLSIFFLF